MFLKSVEIFGFKSFADRTRIEFSEGTTALLGPNGCGKSNIVDAIKWVLGEQSTKTLRAGRMEDVIFNGTDTRKPLQMAEVTLVIDNEANIINIDAPEIEIKRRIFRTGESEYYINRERSLLKSVRSLFFDTGVGKSSYSVLEQGKIDQILSNKPEDRRYIFEEAAGISKFKVQTSEAKRKLERTDENIAQVEATFREVKRTYETKKTQAEKCFRYNSLCRERLDLEVRLTLTNLRTQLELRDQKQKEKIQAESELADLKGSFDSFDGEIQTLQENMRALSASRMQSQLRIRQIEESIVGKKNLLEMHTQRYREFFQMKDKSAQKAQEILDSIESDEGQIAGHYTRIDEYQIKALDIKDELDRTERLIQKNRDKIEDNSRIISENEDRIQVLEAQVDDLTKEISQLTDIIVVELEKKLSDNQYSHERRAENRDALIREIAHFRDTVAEQKKFLENVSGLGAKVLLEKQLEGYDAITAEAEEIEKLFYEYEKSVPSFIDELVSKEGIITRKKNLDCQLGEARSEINRRRADINLCRDDSKNLMDQVEQLRNAKEELNYAVLDVNNIISSEKNRIADINANLDRRRLEYQDRLYEVSDAQARIDQTASDITRIDDEIASLNDDVADENEKLSNIVIQIEQVGSELSGKQESKNTAFGRFNELNRAVDKAELQIEQLNDGINMLYSTFYENFGKSLKEYMKDFEENPEEDVLILRNRLDDIRKQIAGLGYINQMAEDEFNEAKSQYDFLSEQLGDLAKAKNDLLEIVGDITRKSEELFLDAYKSISENFQSMFRRLFGGGKAVLRLSDPDNVLESGIDIMAQPPGKKFTTLSLLSGGERSMTAVALLFATYQVRPSPFCILDEIDAALDDRNIGFFLSVLDDFSRRSQFIIITHNKHTVIGSSSLLGVTQMEAGVSTTVSYRIGNQRGEDVILNDDGSEVEIG